MMARRLCSWPLKTATRRSRSFSRMPVRRDD